MKAKSIMIQGTASSVGKSIICAGLCRILKQEGYLVSPFKSQNMALNSYVTRDGKEMGRAQAVQAEAAGIEPAVEMNPILLKASAEMKMQVIVEGKVYANMSGYEYGTLKPMLEKIIKDVYRKLEQENDAIVIEGTGCPAEININENDIVNMGMAEMADAPVILVGDINYGGVFASLVGTMLLLKESERVRVKGVIINKFRGDAEILKPGLKMLEDMIHVPVLGVVPYMDLDIDEEDSLSVRHNKTENNAREGVLDVAVIELGYMSNFTDFNIFERIPGTRLRFVKNVKQLGSPDLIIIPGSKSTMEDLAYIRNSGMEAAIKELNKKGTIVFGICGGYQMLGREIQDPSHAEGYMGKMPGMGLLDAVTVFRDKKTTEQFSGQICGSAQLLSEIQGLVVNGYEIHMGVTDFAEGCKPFVMADKEVNGDNPVKGIMNIEGTVFGTYIHGIFDNEEFITGFLNNIRKRKGLGEISSKPDYKKFKETQFDMLADVLRKSLDMEKIKMIMGLI
ncbi:MAG: cobyric acid synthase [Bacillota bacterium]|nr:cobyric acid synthase [Bacillota bacterium]